MMQNVLVDNLILPKSDVMFKKLFGSQENLHLLKDLLSNILKIPKKQFVGITLENSEQNPNHFDGKKTICDVKVKLKSNETI